MWDLLRAPMHVACAAALPAQAWRLEAPLNLTCSEGPAADLSIGVQSMPGAANVPAASSLIVQTASDSSGNVLDKLAGPKEEALPTALLCLRA